MKRTLEILSLIPQWKTFLKHRERKSKQSVRRCCHQSTLVLKYSRNRWLSNCQFCWRIKEEKIRHNQSGQHHGRRHQVWQQIRKRLKQSSFERWPFSRRPCQNPAIKRSNKRSNTPTETNKSKELSLILFRADLANERLNNKKIF